MKSAPSDLSFVIDAALVIKQYGLCRICDTIDDLHLSFCIKSANKMQSPSRPWFEEEQNRLKYIHQLEMEKNEKRSSSCRMKISEIRYLQEENWRC